MTRHEAYARWYAGRPVSVAIELPSGNTATARYDGARWTTDDVWNNEFEPRQGFRTPAEALAVKYPGTIYSN